MSATTRHMSTLGQANEAWALLKMKYPLGSQNILLDVTGPKLTLPPPPPPPPSPDKVESSPTGKIRPRATAHISQSIIASNNNCRT